MSDLEKLVEETAKLIAAAREEERERCAKLCEDYGRVLPSYSKAEHVAKYLANLIRGKAK